MGISAVDFHCHLDLYPEPLITAARCAKEDTFVLSVTTTPKAWQGTAALAHSSTRIKTALGLHPQLAHQRSSELAMFDALLPKTRYVGEVGLDASAPFKPYLNEQKRVFEHVLSSSSKAGGRILSIHSLRSCTAVLDVLSRHPGAGIPVFHWFTGSVAELDRAIAMGCWFSVGPTMLTSRRGAEAACRMPRNRVITETDGPFGQLHRRSLQPGEVQGAIGVLAQSWKMSELEASSTVLESFRTLVSSDVGGQR